MSKYLIFLLFLSLALRLYGINWDQGNHLHPDERFLTMVTTAMKFSGGYFDTRHSLLNPHNLGYDFYVYGTWPAILTKIIAAALNMDNYDQLVLVGRVLSALFDVGTSVLIYLIALQIFKNRITSFFSSLSYSLAVIPVQLSHFFAVDTFLVFALTASFYFLLKEKYVMLGLFFSLAVSAKISAVLFLPIIVLYFFYQKIYLNKKIYVFPFLISLLIFVRIFYPYLFDGFSINARVLDNWKTLKSFDVPGYFPPAVQWINFSHLSFYFNTLFFGFGLPLGALFIVSFLKSFKILKQYPAVGLLDLWIFGLLIYYSFQFARPLRYLYPIYPAACILMGFFLSKIGRRPLAVAFCLCVGVWLSAFVSIYSKPHSRVQASNWILAHLPAGSKISCEYWDDCLPLQNYGLYQQVQLSFYDLPDTPEKILSLKSKIKNLDYLILSSNRLYGAIPSAPKLYPQTSQFYHDLFGEKLGFVKIAEFTSRPNLYLPHIKICLTPPHFNYGFVSKISQSCNQWGISIVDDYAEESFTVYDHPKVIIFKNQSI